MRVSVSDLQAGDCLKHDIFNENGILVLPKGAVLQESDLSRLSRYEIAQVEIEGRALSLYDDAVSGLETLFATALREGRVHEEDLKQSVLPLVESLKKERDIVSFLLTLSSRHEYTYQHSVQVGALCYNIAQWMGWDEELKLLASYAGFVHDIGKCRIPNAILNKPDKLTPSETEEIRKHPEYGYEILIRSFEDPTLAVATLQHHERMNGSGYPRALTGETIHPIAKIVAVADVYSAMISTRVYQPKQHLLHVLRELQRLGYQELDPGATHIFTLHMVPNFLGKKAELSDGSIGQIVFMNPSDLTGPLVQCEERFIDLSREKQIEIVRVFV